MSKLEKIILNRRQALGLGAGAAAALGLAACSSDTDTDAVAGSDAATTTEAATELDAAAYDKLISEGATADDDVIEANEWAKAVKAAGTLRVGGVETSTLFSLLDEEDNTRRGFDAGLSQLLARYILGDESKIDFTQVTSDTRESLLQNDQVDTVFATYSINDDRKKVISFAGPYYTTKQGILVVADNSDINGVDDLAGKTVAVQSGSTGPAIVDEYAPKATQQEFKTDEEARAALEQGRVDAYVIDATMQMSSIVKNPGKYRLAGEEFGPEDNYGIGLPKDSDGVDFVNTWLQEIEDDETWANLWQVCIGDRIDSDDVPTPPTIGA